MGLDMYLTGSVYLSDWQEEDRFHHNGFPVSNIEYRLGYWRKHPNLHGYIIQEFADGEDECQKIFLEADQLKQIKEAVEQNNLPNTEGFFFGKSADKDSEDEEEAEYAKQELDHTIEILNRAISFAEKNEHEMQGRYKQLYYQASW
jgi:hypothetical protein